VCAQGRATLTATRATLTATADNAVALEGYRDHGTFACALRDAAVHADVNKNRLLKVTDPADYIGKNALGCSFEEL